MNVHELSLKLREMYNSARLDEKVTMVLLFGVKYADEISRVNLTEIVIESGISRSYRSEISKAVKLATYVTPKP